MSRQSRASPRMRLICLAAVIVAILAVYFVPELVWVDPDRRSEDGWKTHVQSNVPSLDFIESPRCNIERIPLNSLSNESFIQRYKDIPVILTVDSLLGRNDNLLAFLSKKSLLEYYWNTSVILSSANAHSHDKQRIMFRDYVEKLMLSWSLDQIAAQSFYLFGDNEWWREDWAHLQSLYSAVPLYDAATKQSLSFGLGGSGSGVPFHTHGPVFAELFYGKKRWFFYPPDGSGMPPFDPDESSLRWLKFTYPTLFDPSSRAKGWHPPMECTCSPGEVIWIPDRWYHSTLNIGETIFISAFV